MMCFDVLLGMRRVTHWADYNKVNGPSQEDKGGQVGGGRAKLEADAPSGRRGGGRDEMEADAPRQRQGGERGELEAGEPRRR